MPITRQPYFLPTQITGCSLWLDAADSNTVTGTTTVTGWTDKSGSGNHAAFDANKPSYTPANKYIETTNNNTHIRLPSAAFTNTTSQTCIIFIIYADKQEGNNNQALFSTLDYGLYQLLRGPTYAPYNIRGNITVDASYTAFKTSLMTTNTVLYSIQYTAGITGADNYAVAPFGNYWHPISQNYQYITSDIYLGGVSNFDNSGDFHANLKINEVIAYNNVVLTTTQRQQVESYLAQKWGLTPSLISGHPGLQKIIHRNLQTTLTKTQYFTAFSPRQIAGCVLWLDGADPAGTGVLPANNSTLSTWADKSGNGVNMTGSSSQPSFLTNAFNGKPTVSFAATQGVSSQYLINSSTNLYNSVSNLSIFMVIYIPATTPNFPSPISLFGKVTIYMKGGYSGGISAGSLYPWTFNNNNNVVTSLNNFVSANNYYICCFQFNTNQTFFMNGDTGAGGPTAFTFGSSSDITTYIGYSGYNTNDGFNGYISEIITYNTVVSTTQRRQVESYLAQKWGLVSSLPAGHLNATFPAGSPTAIQPYVTSIRTALIFQGKPPSAVGSVSIASLTTITASFTWSSGTLATSYNFYIITPSGTSTLVASNIAYSAGATTITFSSTLTYASGNWTGGVQSVNQYGSSTTVLSGTTTMATPFPYSLNPITTASRTNYIFRDTRRQNQSPAYYWTHCIKLSDDSWAELRTNYSDTNSYVSLNSSGGDTFSSGETDPFGNSLFFYYENGFAYNDSYKHYVRTLSGGNSTAAFIAGTKTASPSVSIQLGNGTFLINNKTTALYSDNGYLL